jgi:uncharacterized protein (DUF58 family)
VNASLTRYLDPEVLRSVGSLDLRAKCIAEGFLAGLHRSPRHGFSTDFSEHRKYVPGDDPKFLDWNLFARTDRLYVRKYEAQTNLPCTMLVDVSASMAYGHKDSPMSKIAYATCLGAAMGWLLLKQRDSVGLATFDEELRAWVKPANRPKQLQRLIGVLANAKSGPPADFGHALSRAANLIPHRGIVMIFSDFLGDRKAFADGLRRLAARGHDLMVFHVLDQAEVELPFDFLADFTDPENRESRAIADAARIRKAYQEEIAAFQQEIADLCQQNGVDHLALHTGTRFDEPLRQLLTQRA